MAISMMIPAPKIGTENKRNVCHGLFEFFHSFSNEDKPPVRKRSQNKPLFLFEWVVVGCETLSLSLFI